MKEELLNAIKKIKKKKVMILDGIPVNLVEVGIEDFGQIYCHMVINKFILKQILKNGIGIKNKFFRNPFLG